MIVRRWVFRYNICAPGFVQCKCYIFVELQTWRMKYKSSWNREKKKTILYNLSKKRKSVGIPIEICSSLGWMDYSCELKNTGRHPQSPYWNPRKDLLWYHTLRPNRSAPWRISPRLVRSRLTARGRLLRQRHLAVSAGELSFLGLAQKEPNFFGF